MLNKLEKFNHRLSDWFEWVGVAGILLMMVVTCIDVTGAKLFKSPLFGALDIVQLSQLMAISFAASMTLILGRHIEVEFFVVLLPRKVQAVIRSVVLLIVLGFFILIIWRLLVLGYSFHASGEYTPTAYIPYYPFVYSVAAAFIPFCLVLVQEFLKSLRRGGQK